MTTQLKLDYESYDDLALARLIEVRDPRAVRLVTTRNNQRLFRAAWSILKNHAESEDVVQSAYLRAFAAIATFEGRSTLSTWLRASPSMRPSEDAVRANGGALILTRTKSRTLKSIGKS